MPTTRNIKEQVDNLPDTPGVYFFLGRRGGKHGRQILYIGKATSLRDRVKSYFRADIASARSSWIGKMVALVNKVEHRSTDSVLEALILESAEIKKHQPPYNTREKDDKSYLYVVLTKEDFPRVLVVRGKDLVREDANFDRFTLKGSDTNRNLHLCSVFGPFPHGGELREAMKIVRRIFPYRDSCKPESGKPCFNAQIGLCPGVCSGVMSKKEYGQTIRNLTLFFQGKKAQVLKNLERQMRLAAKAQEFERAAQFKKKIFALQHIQDVALIKRSLLAPARGKSEAGFRLEAYDVAHLSGTNSVGVMVVAVGQELAKGEYRKFKLRGRSAHKSDDTGNLLEILTRRLQHREWPLPNTIVVDGSKAQVAVAEGILREHGLTIPVVAVTKDERHKARALSGPTSIVDNYRTIIIQLNQEAHRFAIAYHRQLRGRMVQ